MNILVERLIIYLTKKFSHKEYVGAPSNRSESDTGDYVACVSKIANNPRRFQRFKRNPIYRQILEHTTKEQAQEYLNIVLQNSPELIALINDVKRNDLVGSPFLENFKEVGLISTSTLRYLKVASDLRCMFGDLTDARIAEVGVGYGGQLLVLDSIYRVKSYTLFDLPPVLQLVEKYLECHVLQSSYQATTINQFEVGKKFDLVISNYAFSELPALLQSTYIRKIFQSAERGYLTMNSGHPADKRPSNKLKLDQIRQMLPQIDVIEEVPRTSPYNYIIRWGHR